MIAHETIMYHWNCLCNQHDDLDRKIQEAYHQYDKDELIYKMKAEKLRIKENIFQLEKKIEEFV